MMKRGMIVKVKFLEKVLAFDFWKKLMANGKLYIYPMLILHHMMKNLRREKKKL